MDFDGYSFDWLTTSDVELLQAVSAFENRQFQLATESAAVVLQEDDANDVALMVVALSRLGLYDSKGALAVSDRLVEVAPGNWQSYIVKANALLAEKTKNGPIAIEVAKKAIELAPDDADAFVGLAWVASRVGHRQSDAIDAATKALALDPDSVSARSVVGALHRLRSEWSQAIGVYEDALRLRPEDPYLLLQLAEAQEAAGHRKAASETYSRLGRIDQADPELPHGALLEGAPPPESVRSIMWSVNLGFIWLFFASMGMIIAWVAKPIALLMVLVAVVACLTFITPLRTAISTRVWPMKMGRAEGRSTWTGKHPDIVFGICTLVFLLAYLGFALLSASRA